jgi:hypothetical protein
MLLQMLPFALVGCVLSLAFDWVMFEQVTLMVRGPSESGDFTYGDSAAPRMVAQLLDVVEHPLPLNLVEHRLFNNVVLKGTLDEVHCAVLYCHS